MSIVFKNDAPYIEEKNLIDLLKSIETPFYIYSQKNIKENLLELKSYLDSDIYFAIKANSNQAIIELLNKEGVGADVVSVEELQRALLAKVDSKKIIFEGVGKSSKDLEFAINKDIRQINVESIQELEMINQISKNNNKNTSIGIRVNPDIDSKSIDKISTGKKNDKFGITFDNLPAVCNIINNFKNVKFLGLSCHVGSQIFDLDIFSNTFDRMLEAIKICSSNSLKVEHLDLGGGFGVNYENNAIKFNLEGLSKLIKLKFQNPHYTISFEPGRYLVANAGFLLTKIITIKKNSNTNFIITDAGMHTLLRPALYNSFHNIIPINKKGDKTYYTIAGPICESSDILAKNILIPKQNVDDYLIICDVGAYGSVMASNYNSRGLPAEILINSNKHKIIRDKENIQTMIEKDKVPEWI